MSDCQPYFSPFELSSSSPESEVGWTTQCIPNTTKLALFIVTFLGCLGSFSLSAVFAAMEWRNTTSWTLRRKVFVCNSLGLFAQLILQILYLSGVQSRWRYLLNPMIGNSTMISGVFMVQVFVRVQAESISNNHKRTLKDNRLLFLDKLNTYYVSTACLIAYVIYGILPIVFYERPLLLNALYTSVLTFMMFASAFACVLFALIALRLSRILHPDVEIELTPDLVAVKDKLRGTVVTCIIFTIVNTLTLLFPLWIGLTAESDEEPGMRGIFYFHFCFLLPYHYCGSVSTLWAAMKAKGAGISESSGNTSGKRVSTSPKDHRAGSEAGKAAASPSASPHGFAFTIEELNGNV